MPERPARSGATCARPADRLARGVGAALMLIVATSVGTAWCAVPAGICAACLAIGAVTGWCPTDLFKRRPSSSAPNEFGYAEARDSIRL